LFAAGKFAQARVSAALGPAAGTSHEAPPQTSTLEPKSTAGSTPVAQGGRCRPPSQRASPRGEGGWPVEPDGV